MQVLVKAMYQGINMIKDIVSLFIKLSIQFVFWVFVLSVSWDGEPLFNKAHKILVKNELVETISEKSLIVWDNFYTSFYSSLKNKVSKQIK